MKSLISSQMELTASSSKFCYILSAIIIVNTKLSYFCIFFSLIVNFMLSLSFYVLHFPWVIMWISYEAIFKLMTSWPILKFSTNQRNASPLRPRQQELLFFFFKNVSLCNSNYIKCQFSQFLHVFIYQKRNMRSTKILPPKIPQSFFFLSLHFPT